MSMQIKFKDDYNETTYYFGTVTEPESTSHGECDFVVEVVYFSRQGSYTVSSIEWVNEPEDKEKAEERITLMVMKWHYGDPSDTIEREDIISPHDPGDENVEKKQSSFVSRKSSMTSSIGYRGEE